MAFVDKMGAGQIFRSLRNGNQMYMVRHQTPGPYGNVVVPAPLGHQIERDKGVFVTEERLLPPVPRWVTWCGKPGAMMRSIRAMGEL